MSTAPDVDAPVIVIGGSLVGMFAAALLGRQGVTPLVVERHRGSAIHPRAAMIYQKSMEIARGLGIEDVVRERSFRQFEPDGAIMSVESIAGKELHWDIPRLNEHVRDLSPCERLLVSQDALEPIVKVKAEEFGARLHFNSEMVSLDQDADGVTAVIRHRDSGDTFRARAPYLIAADGSHSAIRQALGIPMRGHGLLSRSVTIYFRADVAPLMRGRNLSVILVRNPAFRGFFRIERPFQSGFMIVHTLGDPEAPDADAWTLSEQDCLALLRVGLGADVPVAIDSIQKWACEAHVAERYRSGRIFLAGDAAHVMPPYGGFGGNVGIHDADNLAWKLALVLSGRAPAALLDTYEAERRPVAELTMEQAYTRYVLRAAHYLGTAGMQAFVPDANVDLGCRYHSPVIAAEPDDDGAVQEDPRQAKGRPGTRLPHVWLESTSGSTSTIDLCGGTFVLLAGRDGVDWISAARAASEAAGLPLRVHVVGAGSDQVLEAVGVTSSGASLVRPDGVVAWRSAGGAGDPAAVLGLALRKAVGYR
jgi:2-polyprenyl-6-methoxyphenol hydroxylase-like FAD-dependent oxidoreductase